MSGDLGQRTVDLGTMVRRAAEESYLALRELVDSSRAEAEAEAQGKESVRLRSDTEKKIDLLKFVARTRQRMLRLHVLTKWCQQVPLVNYCQQLASTLSSHEMCFTQTADSLFFMHDGLQQSLAPIFDVPFATEVLRTMSYRRLPKCIEEIGTQNTLFQDERRYTLKKLNTLVRAKLLETSIPKEISEVSVTNGIANLHVDGEFRVVLTVGYRGLFSLWRLLHIELLMGDKTGPVKLEETRRYALSDDIERRMANTDNPLMILYTVLHELCVSLVMDTIIRQANILRQGRWKDAIKSELISDTSAAQCGNYDLVQLGQDGELDQSGFRIPGLKVNYWLGENSNGSTEPVLTPFITIEAGMDMLINCIHSSFILDPLTDKEADLSIDLSCIDVEALILKAISCNRHTRFLEIQRELSKNVQISQSPTDVVLKREVHVEGLGKRVDERKFENSCANEFLQVRAYGQSYIHLGINIRSGRLLLQSSENILLPSVLSEFEEALNKGTLTASDVFVTLKRRSILHLFAGTGRFLGLKVYTQSQVTLKIPKSVFYGSDFMVMGFSQCTNAYYLLIQLDNDFRPVFHLLEMRTNESNRSNAEVMTDANHAVRFKWIDIRCMQICEDECCVNLFDTGKALQHMVNYNQSIEGSLKQCVNENLLPLMPSLPPSFSSLVDEVFEHNPSSSTTENQFSPPLLGNISTKFGGPSRKRSLSEILFNIPSLQQSRFSDGARKKRKAPECTKDAVLKEYSSSAQSENTLTYGSVFADENHSVTSAMYASVLSHVIKHCSHCIKYAGLTSQMDSLGIPYAEEVGPQASSFNLWLRLPFLKECSWKHVCLCLGKTGSMSWDVRINDPYYVWLWKVHVGSTTEWGTGVRMVNTSKMDAHITFDDDGAILTYHTVEAASIHRLVSDLQRLSNARAFSCSMRRLIGVKADKQVEKVTSEKMNLHPARKGSRHRQLEQMRKTFRIEAVGLISLWFSYLATPMIHFVVEWEADDDGCTIHVSPDQLWPHTKFLEEFVNVGDVASFLDCIRLTVGPLFTLSIAIHPSKMPMTVPTVYSSVTKQSNFQAQGTLANKSLLTNVQNVSAPLNPAVVHSKNHSLQSSMLSGAGRSVPGLISSPSLPFDVAIVLCGPYWIRVVYRKIFSIDIRCFSGDQVWLQPATPPKGGPSVGGSLPLPQFRPFIMEHISQVLNAFEPVVMSGRHSGVQLKAKVIAASGNQQPALPLNVSHGANCVSISRPTTNVSNQVSYGFTQAGSAMVSSKRYASGMAGTPALLSPGTNLPLHIKGELSSAFTGLGNDGGYGGAWVPLGALKKVLRGILKYLGILWLFSQFPGLLKEILGSVLSDNEGALLNLDQEQPALRFFVGGYVFAVSVQRVQLLLQVLNVKKFHHQQQKKQQQALTLAQEELATSEINEICDYFSRRVTCEPYDASRVASFITLLTLPISTLREFITLIAWKKSKSQAHGETASLQRIRVELCLEKHQGSVSDDRAEGSSSSKSNIKHDRTNHSVDFSLTFVLDHALKHHSILGGAALLPYCVSVRLRYRFGDNAHVMFLAIEGSHGGKACWLQYEDWERCQQMVIRAVETGNGCPAIGETGQGRLRLVAEMIHKQLELSLQQLRDFPLSAG